MSKQAECEGKEKLSPARAKKVAKAMVKRGKRDVAVMAYKCNQCRHWHIGGSRP